MIKVTQYGEVKRFDLAKTIAGRGRYWTTCYLVDDTLIDSGPAHTDTELLTHLKPNQLARIINTHSHEDHIGANAVLQKQYPELQIYAHPLALAVLEDPRGAQPLQRYRRLFWGWPMPCIAQPISDGERIVTNTHSFDVIHTGGHSRDHICLYEPDQGWIFSGDLFVGGRDRALGASYDIHGIIAGLKKLAALPAKILFPGSARVRMQPAQALNNKIDYLEDLGGRVQDLHKKGFDIPQIARQLLGGPKWIELITWGRFSRQHLIRSYLKNQA